MKKFLDPKWITTVFTMFAIAINNKFGWGLSELELGASIAVSVNFIWAQLAVDFAKMKNGEEVKWSKTKFATMVFACVLLGFTQYVGIDLDTEDIFWITGVAMAFISGKGLKDIIEVKTRKKEATSDDSTYRTPIDTAE
jgi:hypothetical protein